MSDEAAALALAAARRAVGRAAATGGPPPDLSPASLAADLEGDAQARAALDAAAVARAAREPMRAEPEPGPAAARRRRADEVHHAVDALLLAGELAPDGPGRVALPGFGPSTWRAIRALRGPGGSAERTWAAAVTALPLADLGEAAPPELRGLPADPALLPGARRLLALEAERQDVRDALIRAEAALAVARERGNVAGAPGIAGDLAALRRVLGAADRAAADAWDAGVRAAGGEP